MKQTFIKGLKTFAANLKGCILDILDKTSADIFISI